MHLRKKNFRMIYFFIFVASEINCYFKLTDIFPFFNVSNLKDLSCKLNKLYFKTLHYAFCWKLNFINRISVGKKYEAELLL